MNNETTEDLNKMDKGDQNALRNDLNSDREDKNEAHQKLNETRDGFGVINDYSEVKNSSLGYALEKQEEYMNTVLLCENDKMEHHWADQWKKLNDVEKMVIATLHWDKLQEWQKAEFNDHVALEISAMRKKRIAETYTNPAKMREYFLAKAGPVLDIMIDAALSPKKEVHINEYAMAEVWGVFKDILTKAKSPAPLLDIKGKTITEQINGILTSVTQGKMTFEEAQEYMSLVSQGFNIQELPKLMEQLEKLES